MNIVGEWTTMDKTAWGDGPWQREPDKVHWIDETTNLDCLIVRSKGSGAWCGYVAVTEGHPLFGVEYSGADVEVHGSLTYSGFCMETDDESQFVCHVPQPGRPDRVWWLGFDCSHLYDLAPAYVARHPDWLEADSRYRDRHYVEREVRSLARQLAGLAR